MNKTLTQPGICLGGQVKIVNTEISITLGIFAVLIGIALMFLKVEPGELQNHAHLSPGIALFRFGVWRYGMAAVLIVGGVDVISYSIS